MRKDRRAAGQVPYERGEEASRLNGEKIYEAGNDQIAACVSSWQEIVPRRAH
jgi:hypothetical protein